jgi:hypothetical protein
MKRLPVAPLVALAMEFMNAQAFAQSFPGKVPGETIWGNLPQPGQSPTSGVLNSESMATANWTPIISCSSGTIGSVVAGGTYRAIGKMVWVREVFTVNGSGTCSGATTYQSTVPFTDVAPLLGIANQVLHGQNMTLDPMIQGNLVGGGVMVLQNYDGTILVTANGQQFTLSGWYEAQ